MDCGAGFGYAAHGLSGAATAGVASFFTTSSLAVLMADAGAGVEIGTRVGSTQRFIGALALLACLSGAFLGGWTWDGWRSWRLFDGHCRWNGLRQTLGSVRGDLHNFLMDDITSRAGDPWNCGNPNAQLSTCLQVLICR